MPEQTLNCLMYGCTAHRPISQRQDPDDCSLHDAVAEPSSLRLWRRMLDWLQRLVRQSVKDGLQWT
jgi:hypothetical protein